MRIVITGSPATGKTAVALALAKLLDCPFVSANELAKEIGAVRKGVVNLEKLRRALASLFRKQRNIVAEGHLLCEFALPADAVLVLRCDPRKLLKRYAARGYSKRKAVANAVVEVLDYCLVESEENYGAGKVVQVDLTKRAAPGKILGKTRRRQSDAVDWSPLLLKPPLARLATTAKHF